MSDDDPVRAWLEDLGDSDDLAEAIHLAMDHAPALLATPGVASALISDREGDAPRRMLLFAALVEQARLDMEGRGRLGESFLSEAQQAIEALTNAGALDFETALLLARAYGSADIEAPDSLLSFLVADIQARPQEEGFADDLDAGLNTLQREAGGDPYALHALLVDMLSAVPAPLRPGLVHHVAGRDEAWCGRLALYWLLDAGHRDAPGRCRGSAGTGAPRLPRSRGGVAAAADPDLDPRRRRALASGHGPAGGPAAGAGRSSGTSHPSASAARRHRAGRLGRAELRGGAGRR